MVAPAAKKTMPRRIPDRSASSSMVDIKLSDMVGPVIEDDKPQHGAAVTDHDARGMKDRRCA